MKYLDVVSDYFFSSKDLRKDYNEHEQTTLELAIRILTTHGVGGKFAEDLVRHRFNIDEPNDIHGWDGWKGNRPVEIKTETINETTKLNCLGSFGEHRENTVIKSELYKKEKPFLYSVGVDKYTGKCLYVMETDIGKIEDSCLLFERLSAKSPRISFSQWANQTDSYMVVYRNKPLILENRTEFSSALLWECINGK